MADSPEKFPLPTADDLIAEISGGKTDTDDAARPGSAADADDDDTDADDDVADAASDTDDADDDSDVDDEDDLDEYADDEDDADALAAKDPELAKRLKVIKRTERRQREALARERADFDRERTEWATKSRQLAEFQQQFEQLARRARYNPAGVLEALGVTEDDWEYAGQQMYARSKKGAEKPEFRAAADRMMREREHADELRKTREELEDVKKGLAEREQAAAAQASAAVYLRRIVRKADDSTPRVKALIAANPKRARADLGQTALELAEKAGGDMPKARAVLAAHEKKIARQLRDYGLDPPGAPAGKKPGTAAAATGKKLAAGKKPATAAADTGSEQPDTGAITIPSRDDLLRELRSARSN